MEPSPPLRNPPVTHVKKKSFLKRHGVDRYEISKKLSRRENTVLYLFGTLIFYIALAMIIPLIASYIYHESHRPWIISISICIILSIPLLLRFKAAEHTAQRRLCL